MELNFLPNKILDGLSTINLDKLYEIRMRVGFPVKVYYTSKFYYINIDGLKENSIGSLICNQTMIDEVINLITEHSLYAFNERIKQGYLTTKDGIRIGVAGECVWNDNQIKTIKNFTSINIRIPHIVNNCSNNFYDKLFNCGKLGNTLIISPPFYGKTTLLKDIILKLNKTNNSILVIDERGELSIAVGENIDVIKYSDKLYAFDSGLRSMSPQIVITDEISTEKDWEFISKACNCGVKVVASCHGDCIKNITRKKGFIKGIFDRYVVLKEYAFINNSFEVYDGEFSTL